MKYRADIGEMELTQRATERARALVDVTAEHGGLELTDRERDVVMLGVQLGIASTVAAIRAASIEQSTV